MRLIALMIALTILIGCASDPDFAEFDDLTSAELNELIAPEASVIARAKEKRITHEQAREELCKEFWENVAAKARVNVTAETYDVSHDEAKRMIEAQDAERKQKVLDQLAPHEGSQAK